MPKVTFCPHHLLDIDENISPEVIEVHFVNPLVEFIKSSLESGLDICMSETLLGDFDTYHPWDLMGDQNWSKWIRAWFDILKPLLLRVESIRHNSSQVNCVQRCSGLSANVNNTFCNFLNEIASHTFADGSNEEAVFTPTPWCSNFNDFIVLKDTSDIKFAKFTWYKIYPEKLPCMGQVPFLPPVNWIRSMVPRKGNAPNYGYIDNEQREWVWDRLHDNHWDVQNRGGGRGNYQNVSPEGDVLGEE